MNIQEMEYNAVKAAELLTMMSNPNRLLIMCQLLEGEKCVMELSRIVGLSQSALSQHLAKLRIGKLVATRRDAQTIYYTLACDKVTTVMDALYKIYCVPQSDIGGTADIGEPEYQGQPVA
jgi:DNA-binding transcriptional ArsR family regulator